MKKWILLLLFLPATCFSATYNIGPGQTYTTFAAFHAAVTPTGGDIIDGGGNTFTEVITVKASGSSGSYITYQNIVCNSGGTNGFTSSNKSYIVFDNVTCTGYTSYGISATSGGSNVRVVDSSFTGGTRGIYFSSVTDPYVEDCTVKSTSEYGMTFSSCTRPIVNGAQIGTGSSDACSGGINFSVVTGPFLVEGVSAPYAGLINTRYGMRLDQVDGVSAFSSFIRDCSFSYSTANNNGVYIEDSHDFTLQRVTCSNRLGTGFGGGIGAYNIVYRECVAEYNSVDGFSMSRSTGGPTHDVYYIRCLARYNGVDGSSGEGDGFTLHEDCYNFYYAYNISSLNKNTGIANIGTTSGYILNNVFYRNGSSGTSTRGGIYLPTTGVNATTGVNWIVANNIVYENYNSDVWISTNEVTNGTRFNNCYHSLDPNKMATINVGSTYITWASYQSNETNSMDDNPDFSSTTLFTLQTGSPCIASGARSASFHNTLFCIGDYAGDPIAPYDHINIGAYGSARPSQGTILQ